MEFAQGKDWFRKTSRRIAKKTRETPHKGCLMWTGYVKEAKEDGTKGHRYGILSLKFPGAGSRTTMHVHRLAYIGYKVIFIKVMLNLGTEETSNVLPTALV